MIRASQLAVSRPMYAFNRSTWRPYHGWYMVDAVWFKRKRGELTAVMGTYTPSVLRLDEEPPEDSYEAWITASNDNRYGGRHLSSWDGLALLTTDPPRVTPEIAAERTAFLKVVLAGYPDPPVSHDGWWTFPPARDLA